MKSSDHSKFPVKKALIASITILICYLMVLVLFMSIAYSASKGEYSWVVAVVWAGLLVISLIVYWTVQIVRYIKNRKDENKR